MDVGPVVQMFRTEEGQSKVHCCFAGLDALMVMQRLQETKFLVEYYWLFDN